MSPYYTASSNGSGIAGGIFNYQGTVNILGSIISGDTASSNPDLYGIFSSLGYNLFGNTNNATGFTIYDMVNQSANLDALADNGGMGRTHALLPGSLAINAGPPTGAPSVDQRGASRLLNRPDIGALEYGVTGIPSSPQLPETLQYANGLLVLAGSNAVLNVGVSGGSLSYYWFFNANYYSSTTNSQLSFATINPTNAGLYSLLASNSVGQDSSPVMAIDVVTPPTNTIIPMLGSGSLAVFVAGPEPVSYQWVKNGGNIAGETNSTLQFPYFTLGNEGSYSVLVSNRLGSLVTPAVAVAIPRAPGITSYLTTTGKVGVAFSYAITASNFPSRFGATGLPAGLTCNTNTGLVGGIPTVAGSFNVSIMVSNSYGADAKTLVLAIAPSLPTITSSLSASGAQGQPFTYTITASNNPTSFSASGLPSGLTIIATNGVISGTPLVSGTFNVTIGSVSPWGTDSKTLILAIASAAPGITSSLNAAGKQGQSFSYTITASNSPTSFSSGALPSGLTFAAGTISGTPLVSGSFLVTIGAANTWGTDSKTLTLTIASSVPVITSATSGSGSENSSYSYQITATDSPTTYGASGLPLGLSVNAISGLISGTPLYGGPFTAVIWAQNAWGTGSNTLTLNLNYAAISGLSIQDVQYTYSSPYLLDFVFSLRDSTNTLTSHAVVRPLTNFTASIFQSGTPLDPYESTFLLDYATKKQLRCYVVLDYSASMVKTNAGQAPPFTVKSPQVVAMEAAAKAFINQLPADALIGIYEFHGTPAPAKVKDFNMNKTVLNQAVDSIFTNAAYNIANTSYKSKCWDAIKLATDQFDTNAVSIMDEHRYVVFISDGNDTASTNTTLTAANAALNKSVKLYCAGYGNTINTNALTYLTSTTKGHVYFTQNASDLSAQFGLIGKDIDGQYFLRWATTMGTSFKPSFTIASLGYVAAFNTNAAVDMVPWFDPTSAAVMGNEFNGVLRFVASASDSAGSLNLRSVYAPIYVSHLRLHYRANYPCTVTLQSVIPGEIMNGWSLTTTNDGTGGVWLDLASGGTYLPVGALGNLLRFNLRDMTNAQTAFSFFDVDNSIYAGGMGQNFAVQNASGFITVYPATPHGTPVPWLLANGFTGDMTAAELSDPDGDGIPTWQEYYAGTNPRSAASKFTARAVAAPIAGQPYQMTISTVVGRTYRVETATSLGSWSTLQDGIAGTGSPVTVTDNRDLSGVTAVFYRVAVY
ncbi:MAG: putative Ig domain-containing protein [Verrucomicrobiota bacterium]